MKGPRVNKNIIMSNMCTQKIDKINSHKTKDYPKVIKNDPVNY